MPVSGITARTAETRRGGSTGKESSSSPSRSPRLGVLLDPGEIVEIPGILALEPLHDLPQAVADVPDHLVTGEVDRIEGSGGEVYVDDLEASVLHEEGGLLDDIVAGVDDQVGVLDGAVQVIVGRQRRVAEVEGVALVDHPLPHLGAEERHAGLVDELRQHAGSALAIGAGAGDQQRAPGRGDHLDGPGDRLFLGDRAPRPFPGKQRHVDLLVGDVFGQLEMDGSGAFFLGDPEGLRAPWRVSAGC